MIGKLERFMEAVGVGICWLVPLMAFVTCVIVVLRYGFGVGIIFLQELVTYFHAIFVMLGLSYTLKHDAHVRVDLIYSRLPSRRKLWTNLLGHLVLMLPVAITIIVFSWRYTINSWLVFEGSAEVGGVPAVFLLKTLIPAGAVLLIWQTLIEIVKTVNGLREMMRA